MRTLLAIFITGLLLLLAGAAAAQQDEPENPVTEIARPYDYVSADGEFRVTWPSGCAKLRRRSSVPEPGADPFETVRAVHVSCDRNGREGEGCSVAAIFNQLNKDGGVAGPDEVIERLEEQLGRFGVTAVEQAPIARELPDGRRIEGLDLRAVDQRNVGEVWLRGVLSDGDIYVLVAWKLSGGLFDDPDYQMFFNSFLPGVE